MQPHPYLNDSQYRSKSDGDAVTAAHIDFQMSPPDSDIKYRPTLSDKHAVSWGATTVNKKLRNQVFGEAFLQQPIPIQRHKKPASQKRSLPIRHGVSLRASNSESSLKAAQQSQQPAEDSIRRKAMRAAAERSGFAPLTKVESGSSGTGEVDEEEQFAAENTTGTSAPEPEISHSPQGKRQRRYSSGGLRRKPTEVAEDRGNLKYFEEADDAGYKGDREDNVFEMDPEPVVGGGGENGTALKNTQDLNRSDGPLSTGPNCLSVFVDIPRPVNPKEAQAQSDSRVEFFLLLEDLTAGMKRPCIMDLKMGTRQYGVEANEKKQKSQQRKCAATTSRDLGVRVCGLQVWDVKTQSYIFQDKYFGRDLKAGHEFQEALTRFLYDGVDYASVLRHIPTIVAKLSKLEVLIRGLVGYRFYAASLLVFYDGEAHVDDESDSTTTENGALHRGEIDFKIADFANCVTKETYRLGDKPCPPRHPNLPDNGFLRGLRSLKNDFLTIQRTIRARESGRLAVEDYHNGNPSAVFGSIDEDEGGISY
jgi:inositol-hexakisphosphate kinase